MISKEQLQLHKDWLSSKPNGKRLICTSTDLSDIDLSEAILDRADLSYSNLQKANLHNASLRGTDLSQTYLGFANLTGVDLSYASLHDADLSYADLTNAILYRTILNYADLRNAKLTKTVDLPVVADAKQRLQAVALAALKPGGLDMGHWHTCNTTHCIAGWAIHLAGETGKIMEDSFGAQVAGLMLLGPEAHQYFFEPNSKAQNYLSTVLESSCS